jgi:signal transduction histidine kinase
LCTEKNGIVKFDLASKKFSTFLSTTTKGARLPSNDVRTIYIKDEKVYYVGTSLGLSVFDSESGNIKSYTKENGLPNEMIYGIIEDNKGKLWISTNAGLSRFDPVTNSFANYSQSEGLQGSEYNTKAYLKLKNKNFVFGGVNGFNIVDPLIVDKTNLIPDMAITGFSLFSREVPVGEYKGKIILDSVIHMKKVIYLDYNENSISFEFTALNFNVNSTTRYSYILEGFEDDWTVPSTERKAVYTNLNAGEYRFAVAAINRDGSRSKNVAELIIIISPPFWRTTWFRILSLIIIIGIFYFGYKYKTNSIRKRNDELENLVEKRTIQLESKKNELEQKNRELIEANASKNRFFSMFSHDLRSPFSAILGYLQILDEDFDELSKSDRTYYFQSLYTVSRNLFSTIENVFNWFRIETGRINEEPKLLLLEQSVKETVDILIANITLKKIEIVVEVEQGTRVWADPVMLKTILQNLISNAIKFSDEEGIISISSDSKDGMVAVSVSDSGRGMSEEDLAKLFDKKVIFTTEGTQQEKGSGLGLLICKEFVEKCGGTITVTSSRDDGTSFTFTLPNTPRTN